MFRKLKCKDGKMNAEEKFQSSIARQLFAGMLLQLSLRSIPRGINYARLTHDTCYKQSRDCSYVYPHPIAHLSDHWPEYRHDGGCFQLFTLERLTVSTGREHYHAQLLCYVYVEHCWRVGWTGRGRSVYVFILWLPRV